MLLGSPSFSDFLERLSVNPSQLPQGPSQVEQPQVLRQAPKDVNPYTAHQQAQRQSIGVAMMPEQNLDFSAFGDFHHQVFAVLETPEPPMSIETAALAGKESNFVGQSFESEDEKVEMPTIEQLPVTEGKGTAPKAVAVPVVRDEDFENNPDFALYHESSAATSPEATVAELDPEHSLETDIFGGIQSEKFLARYELLDASTEEQTAALAMASVQRRLASLEGICSRLEMLSADV